MALLPLGSKFHVIYLIEARGEVTYIFAKMISVQNEVFVLLFLGPYSKEAYVLVFLPYTFI